MPSHTLLLSFCASFAIALTLCGCGGDNSSNIETDVAQTCQLADDGDYAQAMTLGDKLVNGPDTAMLTAGQYCRLGVVYAMAAENANPADDNGDQMATAVRCLTRAIALDSAATVSYIEALPRERFAATRTALQLMGAVSADIDGTDFCDHDIDPDSTYDIHAHE